MLAARAGSTIAHPGILPRPERLFHYGQLLMYQRALQTAEPERTLYLALPQAAYDELSADIFDFPHFEDLRHCLIIYSHYAVLFLVLIWCK